MTDRALTEEGGTAADCQHGYGAIGCTRRLRRDRLGVAAPCKHGLHRHEDIQQGLLSCVRAAACLDGIDRLIRSRNEIGTCRLLRKRLAEFHEEGADQRPGCAADFHHQRHADRLQHLGQRLIRKARQRREHSLKTPLHVQPVIAVTDRLVEAGQFVGVLDHHVRQPPYQLFPGCPIEHHAAILPPSASKYSALLRLSDTTSPAPRFASGSDNVTTGWPPMSRWRWLWSPRCSIRVTVAGTPPPPWAIVRCSVRAPTVFAPRGVPAKRAAGRRLIVGCPSRAAT